MKKAYLECLKKLKKFRKTLVKDVEQKRGRLYFTWIKDKTEKVMNEKDENYIYRNIVKYTLRNYKIDKYNYERLTEILREAVDRNYILKDNNYIFNNTQISYDDAMLITRKILLKRGNVVWVDFGFNIGNEFGGMHPAVILKNFDNELFVVPISSKKPKEYIKIEQDLENELITEEECKKRKEKINSILQIDSIYRFKEMTRWADITRIKKVSLLRLNYSGTIGKISGNYINSLSNKISKVSVKLM